MLDKTWLENEELWQDCKWQDAKELIRTLSSALGPGISVLLKGYVLECHIKVLILLFGDFTQAPPQQEQFCTPSFKVKSWFCTDVSRQHMNNGRSQSTSATGNLQSYELSYLNWDTELEARREVLIFHTGVLRSPDIFTCSPLASFSPPSFLLHYLEKKIIMCFLWYSWLNRHEDRKLISCKRPGINQTYKAPIK